MDPHHPQAPSFDGRLFTLNVNQIPPEEKAKYAGKYVAYSMDGTRILASGADEDEVDDQLRAAGIHFRDVVHSYVPSPEENPFLGVFCGE
jgi:hypothetical protein